MKQDAARLGVLDELVGYHVRRASATIGSDFSQALSGTGIRQVLFGILSVIDANPGIAQGAVGRLLGIQRPNMVSLVNELVTAGLVARKVDSGDRRALSLTLTAEGRARMKEALARIREHEARVAASLSAGERATLIELLRRIGAEGPRPD